MTFEQRFASACLLLLTTVLVYAMLTGKLDVGLAISAITGVIVAVLGGKGIADVIRKSDDKEAEK